MNLAGTTCQTNIWPWSTELSEIHEDFWETASTVFKVLSNIVEEMLVDTAVLILMNMLRLCRASLHSSQDLRSRVTNEEEEEGKAANKQMLLSFSGWAALASAEVGVSWQAELHCRAQQAELPGHKSFSDHKEKFLSQGRAEGMWNLHQCQGTHIPDTLRAAALAADTWRVAQQPPFALNKPILSPDQDSKVSLQHNYWANRMCNHQTFHRNCNICMWGSSLYINSK